MKHALVVGGTGMLSDVSLWLIDNGYHVSIIARNPERMDNLTKKASSKDHVTPLLVNYTNGIELKEKIKHTINQNGSIDTVVAWIHSSAEDILPIIAGDVSNHKHEWELFHVLSSSSNLEKIKSKVTLPDTCIYHQVQLGFIMEGVHSRWLTNQEISEGVKDAIKKKKKVITIGQIEPRENSP